MNRPNLFVGKIIRKTHFKRVHKPPTSTTVKYFNSLQNRSAKLSIQEMEIYEKWTLAIRKSMEKAKLWPSGTEEWTQELVSEYLKRLQTQFWKSVRVNRKFVLENLRHVLIQMIDYPNRRYPDGRHLLRVFKAIFKKIRGYVRRQKICDLNHFRWFVTPIGTASFALDGDRKSIISIQFGDF